MAALCPQGQRTTLTNLLRSDDTQHMLGALRQLGVTVNENQADPTEVTVEGCGGRWMLSATELDLGNAGTAMRPLLAVLAATLQASQQVTLTGNARMQERPIAALVESLQAQHGAIRYRNNAGYPPLQVESGLQAGRFVLDASASSQYVTALLMALPLLPGDSVLELKGEVVSWPYIRLTINMLRQFGIHIERLGKQSFMIRGEQKYQSPRSYWVEGDASAASYWLAAGLLGGGPLRIHGVGSKSLQGDIAFAEWLAKGGAKLEITDHYIDVLGGKWQGISGDFNAIPDAAMTFAPLALFARKATVIENVENWRIKETDRLEAMATELRKFGATVQLTRSSIRIEPPAKLQHAEVTTYDDHRMAMSFALLGFSASGVTICDPDCCAKTYPEFFSEFTRLCQ